jgi:hypothetical protein
VAAAVFALLAAGLITVTVRLFRRAYRGLPAVGAERRALLARRAELLAALAAAQGPPTGPTPAPGPVAGAGPARQPSPWAITMHARFPLGPSPADALRRLPPDAPPWKTWLAADVGWGAAAAVLLLLGTIGTGIVLAVVLTH